MDDSKNSPESEGMISRFNGSAGKDLLFEVLSNNNLLRGVSNIDEFVEISELVEVPKGQQIIVQGGTDNDIYLILSGSFDIIINGRTIATRRVESHVGDMALIDPTARRSATVSAAEHSLVLKCPETQFTDFANKNPRLWRRIAVELARRLTERSKFIPTPRSEPVLFLGCSKEALKLAQEIQSILDYDSVVVEIWPDGIFHPSKTPIEDLTSLIKRIDFGAILLTPDDRIQSRDSDSFGPRDNVIFELGLIMGAIGRERTFMLVPRDIDLKLPSDLLGVKPIEYASRDQATMTSRLGPACHELRKIIDRLGPL